MTCARVMSLSSTGVRTPANVMNSFRSLRYARRVWRLSMSPNHSVSGGTSASSENSALVSARRGSVGRLGVSCFEVAIGALFYIDKIYYQDSDDRMHPVGFVRTPHSQSPLPLTSQVGYAVLPRECTHDDSPGSFIPSFHLHKVSPVR